MYTRTPKKTQKSSLSSNTRVGILFNMPMKPSRGEAVDYVAEAGVQEEVEAVKGALERLDLPHQIFPLKDNIIEFVEALESYKPDVIVNLCEGAFGDSHHEMHVPSLLELLKIPYTGSSPLTLGICQNKGLTKDIFKANGIPTPDYCVLNSIKEWEGKIGFPLFVKPLKEDASVGISKRSYVKNEAQLKSQVEYLTRKYKQPALVAEYVPGRELNVAVLGNEEPIVLPASEIIFDFHEEPKIYDYSAKWIKDSDEYKKTTPICPADLKPSLKARVEEVALKAYSALRCRDYATVDIRLKEDSPLVLEVNTNPDVSPDAFFAMALKAAGIPYDEFVKEIILFTLERATENV